MKYAEELQKIAAEHGGTLYPRDVVEAARDPKSKLHDAFEWNDGIAAEQWRIEQARRLIRVQVTLLQNSNEPIQAYVSLSPLRSEEGGYVPIRDVLSNKKLLEQMKADAARELEIFTAKFRAIDELRPVLTEAGKFVKSQKRKGK